MRLVPLEPRAKALLAALSASLLLTACNQKTADPPHVYALGEKVEAGHIVYRVFDTQWMPQLPMTPTPRVPQQRFFLVRISAANTASGEVVVPNFTLEDDAGATYAEVGNGEGVPHWVGFLRKMKTNENLQGNVVFDVPPQHYRLHVMDENNENPMLVDLPVSFTPTAPEMAIPEGKQE